MSIITMTPAMARQLVRMTWGQRRFDVSSRSNFGAQAIETGYPLWIAEFAVAPRFESQAGPWKAVFLKLEGQVNQIELWDTRRPAPLGTMRGSLTLSSDAAKGATVLPITGGVGQANTTLVQGDYLQVGSGETQQVVMVVEDASATGGGSISVTVQPPLRNAFASGSVVIWDKPKALFRRTASETSWNYSQKLVDGFAATLLEDWRP